MFGGRLRIYKKFSGEGEELFSKIGGGPALKWKNISDRGLGPSLVTFEPATPSPCTNHATTTNHAPGTNHAMQSFFTKIVSLARFLHTTPSPCKPHATVTIWPWPTSCIQSHPHNLPFSPNHINHLSQISILSHLYRIPLLTYTFFLPFHESPCKSITYVIVTCNIITVKHAWAVKLVNLTKKSKIVHAKCMPWHDMCYVRACVRFLYLFTSSNPLLSVMRIINKYKNNPWH